MPPHGDRQRLADALKTRRAALKRTQTDVAKAAGVSLATINLMEREGRNGYHTVTKALVEEAVGWAPGSIDALLAGGDATVMEDEAPEDAGADVLAFSADGRQVVAEVKRPPLSELLERMPQPARELWERLAWRIADELSGQTTANGTTISDDVVSAETEFGTTYLGAITGAQPEKAQVEQAARQLQEALDLLRPNTERSVR